MANIFKTTLKKDVIADIVSNNKREIRFPITKFWSSRFTSEYNLENKTFVFKTFDSLELSSPSNKETDAMIYKYDFVRIYINGDEFVIEFKESCNDIKVDTDKDIEVVKLENVIPDNVNVLDNVKNNETGENDDSEEIEYISNEDIFFVVKQWFDEECILDTLYESESVFATHARQIIILSKGRVLGFKKTLPLNNDNGLRVEFDMYEKIYFDNTPDFNVFKDDIYKTLEKIRENNFVFIWKRQTGIFMEDDGRIYFGIQYSTRKSKGFNNRYNVQ